MPKLSALHRHAVYIGALCIGALNIGPCRLGLRDLLACFCQPDAFLLTQQTFLSEPYVQNLPAKT